MNMQLVDIMDEVLFLILYFINIHILFLTQFNYVLILKYYMFNIHSFNIIYNFYKYQLNLLVNLYYFYFL